MEQNILQRGTTPVHSFTLPAELAETELAVVCVTYRQGRKIALEKGTEDVTIADGTVSVSLTQDETLLFREGTNCLIQLRLRTQNGDALASDVISVCVRGVLKEGVI